jgi:hypothetical protein
MSVPLPGWALTVIGAERPDPDRAEQYRFLAARGTLRMASAIQRM